LEEDDYSGMPEATYVRGYLRNYARLMGIPENDILVSFARFSRGGDSDPQPVVPASENEINRAGKSIKILAVGILLAIVAVSAIWVLMPEDSELPVSSSPQVAVQQNTETASSDATDNDSVPIGSSTIDLDVKEEQAISNSEPQQPAEVASVAPETAVSNEQLPAVTDELQVTEPGQPESEPEPAPVPEEGMLVLSYNKDSWTDVRDANGDKLLYRTVKAGENVALSGELPISLFFGFAQGVEVKFNGKDVDVEAYTRGVFARFTLGERQQ
jgi:cytoskeleton protein RodZ